MNFFLRDYENKRIKALNSFHLQLDDFRSDKPLISTDDSDRYVETAYRYGEGVDGIISDIDVLNDSKTPDSLKEYIQRVGAHAVHAPQNVASMLEDSDQILDSMIPDSLQTASEIKEYLS